MKKRELIRPNPPLFKENVEETKKLSKGAYKDQYMVFIRDLVDEALKDKKLIARMLKSK